MRRLVIAVVLALVLGLVAGYYFGRWQLQKQWSAPLVLLDPSDVKMDAGDDPKPPSGTRVLAAMPLQKAREGLARLIGKDPAVVTVGSVGRDEEVAQLHLMVKNQGSCVVSSFAGVAYGFDAAGQPSRVNRQGQHYVAFSVADRTLKPGQQEKASFPLHHVDDASIVLAQVDEVSCADGTRWRRQNLASRQIRFNFASSMGRRR